MSHTPGEWKVGKDEPFVYALNGAGTNRFFLGVQPGWIADKVNNPWDERTSRDELMANARLIAAAPELLDALKAARIYVAAFGPVMPEDGSPRATLLRNILAAIAKAEGK